MKQCCKLDKGNFYCLLFNARTPLNFLFELLCWETQMCVFICVQSGCNEFSVSIA